MDLTVQTVAALREQLYDAGFRPVPVLNHDHPDPKLAGKAPLGRDWGNLARRDPPDCITRPPVAHALNTGILSDGLRAIDIDVDDPEIAARCRSLVVQAFGEAPIRMRRNSSRCLILYRAATGAPSKCVLPGRKGKVEVLGKGQQFVAFGRHPSGAELEWFPDAPGQEALDAIPAIAEPDLVDLLNQLAPLLDAEPIRQRDEPHDYTGPKKPFDILRIAQALNGLPNNGPADWEWWNKVGMALWAETNGSEEGRSLFAAWSARHSEYDAAAVRERWNHYPSSPPTKIGAGWVERLAREAKPKEPSKDAPASDDIFPVEFFRDIQIATNAQDFVEGLLVSGSMVVIYGESNSGKTFFATDLCCHIACGWTWNDREVERGAVIYCALEGSHGIRHRIAAFRAEHGLDGQDIPLAVIPVSMNLLDPEADTSKLIRTIQETTKTLAPHPVRAIVIDTLSRAISGGNENAPDDMGALVTNGTRIQQETKSCVIWVHHSGKDQAKGARGHSLLRAATDTEIEIIADGASRTATVTKQRDMECAGEFRFTLKVIELGTNHRKKPITSCVVDYSDGAAPTLEAGASAAHRRLKGHAKRALDVLANLIASSGKSGYAGTPAGVHSVPEAWWREQFYERAMPGEKDDTKLKAFGRASGALINEKLVGMANRRVWIAHYSATQDSENDS